MMRLLFALAGLTLVLADCGSAAASPNPLVGTTWQLVSMESTGGEPGTTAVDVPTKYTVTFGDGGHAAFRIDCNRGSGSWDAEASSPETGSLTFGPIAVTRMACLGPTLDYQVSSMLGGVRSYRFSHDGSLSLVGDAGTLSWEPGTPS